MKKKQLNRILIFSVCLVWGVILLKVFSYKKTPSEESPESNFTGMDNDSTIKNDTIIIYADYRDPFRQPVMPVIEEKKLTVKPVISPPSVAWPAISYEGTIKNDKQQKMLALLSVAGERMVITEDTEIKGIRIMRIYQDSITVSYQNQRKAFLKNSL